MADLTDLQAAGTTKIVGSSASGLETNPLAVDSLGAISITVPTVPKYGQKTAPTAGTAVQVSSVSTTLSIGFIVQALAANAGNVYVGDSSVTTSTGFELQPGQAFPFAIKDVSTIYVVALNNGDGVCFGGS